MEGVGGEGVALGGRKEVGGEMGMLGLGEDWISSNMK